MSPISTLAPAPPGERIAALAAARDLIASERAAVHAVLTEISTGAAATYEIGAALSTLDGAAAEVARHRPPRLDLSAVFMPSNMLLYSYVLYLLVPSLFVDRSVFRPSRQVRDQTVALHELLAPAHQLPVELADVSQRAFLRDPVPLADLVVFTGRHANGAEIASQLGGEQLFLFFGQGTNPVVVCADADLPAALAGTLEIRLFNSGQDCLGPDVVFVPEPLLDRFVDGLVRRLDRLRFGGYRDPSADYGPICYDSALADTAQVLHRHRARIVAGGTVDFRSRRVEPTVLVSRLGDEPEPTEFFAPVFNVVSYPDEQALRVALTATGYADRALGASVYGDGGGTGELTAALRRRHTVTVDTTLTAVDDGNQPFGGWGPLANYVSYRGRREPQPILISQAVAEHWRAA